MFCKIYIRVVSNTKEYTIIKMDFDQVAAGVDGHSYNL